MVFISYLKNLPNLGFSDCLPSVPYGTNQSRIGISPRKFEINKNLFEEQGPEEAD